MSKNTKSARRKARYKKAGLCTQCGQRAPVEGGKTCEQCRKYYRDYRARLRKKGLCKCGRRPAPGGKNCELCREKTREYNRALRDEVFEAYGGYKCRCCGETHKEFLQIDHINNDGAEHRRSISNKGTIGVYYWLKKHKFPPGFQVLCANCNYAKAHYGYCPHRPDKEVNDEPINGSRHQKAA